MAQLVSPDRVLETSTTTGTGSYQLAGAVTGYRAASAVAVNNDTVYYYAEDVGMNGVPLGGWETGLGTWKSGNILERTTIHASSNANNAVNWSSGTRRIGLSATNAVFVGVNTSATDAASSATNAASSASAASTSATNAASSASAASTSATDAASSAVTAINAPGTSATSTTSLTIDNNNKTLTIQTGKSIVVGMFAMLAYTTDATKWMYGVVTAYNSGTGSLTLSNITYSGSGTYAVWTLSLSAPQTRRDLYINSNTQLAVGYTYIIDSTGGVLTHTMPLTPSIGDMLTIRDCTNSWTTNNVTLSRNGQNFVNALGVGVAENLVLNLSNVNISLIFTAAGWRAI